FEDEHKAAQDQNEGSDHLERDHEVDPPDLGMSTILTPDDCSTLITSPRATCMPLTQMSNGSPAGFFSSMMEPGASRIRSRTRRRKRPTSMVMCTETS